MSKIKEAQNTDFTALVKAMDQQDMRKFLEEIKDNPKSVNEKDYLGATPLHYSASVDFAYTEILVAHKAYINCKTYNGITPIVTAIDLGNYKAAEFLFYQGAEISLHHAFLLAANTGNKDILEQIDNLADKQKELRKTIEDKVAKLDELVTEIYTIEQKLHEARKQLQYLRNLEEITSKVTDIDLGGVVLDEAIEKV